MTDSCSICDDTTDQTKFVQMTSCDHKFHLSCINQWIRINPTCPLCRAACGRRPFRQTYTHFFDCDDDTGEQATRKRQRTREDDNFHRDMRRAIQLSEVSDPISPVVFAPQVIPPQVLFAPQVIPPQVVFAPQVIPPPVVFAPQGFVPRRVLGNINRVIFDQVPDNIDIDAFCIFVNECRSYKTKAQANYSGRLRGTMRTALSLPGMTVKSLFQSTSLQTLYEKVTDRDGRISAMHGWLTKYLVHVQSD
jgi:hypothetical protein